MDGILTQKMADALVDAAVRGVRQARQAYVKGRAMCALRVIERGVDRAAFLALRNGTPLRCDLPNCPEKMRPFYSPAGIVVHLNDAHRWDFLTIARKMGPSA